MKDLEFKSFQISEHKADESGNLVIVGYGAIFGNLDSYGDIIQPGAFAETLSERKERIAFCYQHDTWNPVGKILEISEDSKGLLLKVMISAAEMDIQTKVREGILKEMSIGYRVMEAKEEDREGENVRLLTKLKLYEVSLVTIAANPLAIITGMKSEEGKEYLEGEFNRLLAIIKNENINYEIRKLKAVVTSVLALEKPEPQKEEGLKADEILRLLTSKN